MDLAQPFSQIERVLRRIQEMLDSERASSTSVAGASVKFTSGLFPHLFGGPLRGIASGRIDIEQSGAGLLVRYLLVTLRAWEAMLVAIIFAYGIWRSPTATYVATMVATCHCLDALTELPEWHNADPCRTFVCDPCADFAKPHLGRERGVRQS
jgi:hypothetical protein